MIRKSFAFILLLVLTGVTAIAQDAPKSAKAPKEKKARKAYSVALSSLNGGSYLGVYMEEVTNDNFSKYGLSGTQGVAVTKVAEDSPASKAGLQANDVVVRFNGESVTSVRKLRRLISEVAPDHSAKISVLRGGSERTLDVKMGKRKNAFFTRSRGGRVFAGPNVVIPRMPRMPAMPNVSIAPGRNIFRISSRSIGASLTPLTKQLGAYFGVSDGKGLLVKSVGKDSAAEKGGLKAGDVIVEIDGKKVSRTYDLIHALGQKKEGDVNLTVVRDKRSRTIKVTPKKSKNASEFIFEGSNWNSKDGQKGNIVIEGLNWVREEDQENK